MDNPPTHIRIRDARQAHGLSQAAMGRIMKPPRPQATISDVESGKQAITVELLEIIAIALDMSPRELVRRV